jgi:hypothetical protein
LLGVFPDTSIINEELKEIDSILNAINDELNNINSQNLSNIQSQLQAINSEYSSRHGFVIFTSSQNWTVPDGVYRIKVLAIGGGGGGGGGYSTTYVGGGGGSGGIVYAEVAVEPGTNLSMVIAAGGSPGTGGANPTAGGNGGNTNIHIGSLTLISSAAGKGGGAATSSANGSAGGSANSYQPLMQGLQSNIGVFLVAAYGSTGNGGSGQQPGLTPVLAPSFSVLATSAVTYGASNLVTTAFDTFGDGGAGGGVNSNGQPGIQGAVIIWWGD